MANGNNGQNRTDYNYDMMGHAIEVLPVDPYNDGSLESMEAATTMQEDVAATPSPNPGTVIPTTTDVNTPLNQGLRNADLNFSQYGDDSSAANQATAGGQREKNTGEGVATSNIAYNPNADVNNLNYKFGKDAQYANSDEAGYLARRNDEIASALYNAGKTSMEDIVYYLAQQPGWMNSTELDRVNTANAIWKRLGELSQQQGETQQSDFDESRMQEGIQETSEGTLYGKNTPDEGNPEQGITALPDINSVYQSMEQSRIDSVKQAMSLSSDKIAYMMADGLNPISEMTMRDLQQYYPEKYSEIQAEYKKIIGQQNVDNISMGGTIDVTSQLQAGDNNVTTSMNYFVNSTASGSAAGNLATNLNNALAESEIASTAREQREIYKRKIIEIQQAAASLEKDANAYFKGDVPDYMVKAFINNRMQKYNKEIEKYQQLFNASLDEEKWEVSQQQWNTEMNYKWSSLNADINYKNAELALSQKKAEMSTGHWNEDGTYSYIGLDGVMHTLSRAEAEKVLNSDLYNKSTSYIDYWKKAIDDAKSAGYVLYGDQCEVMTDKYTNQFWGVTMTKEDGTALTLAEDKAKYVTDAIPERGFVAIWDYGIKQSDGKNYGHTGIVIDYDPITGKFTTLESNRKKTKDGTPIITIQEMDINDSHLLGFWDPTKGTPWNKTSSGSNVMDIPMLDVFAEIESSDKYTADVKNDSAFAKTLYIEMSDFVNSGEMDELATEDFTSKLSEFKKYLYGNLKNNNMFDDKGNILWTTLKQAMLNQGMTEKQVEAYDSLHKMIQSKLRKESGAAINISEWLGDYDMYMPQPGMSKQTILTRFRKLENVGRNKLPATILKEGKYIPIITDEMIANASTEAMQENAVDILKRNR